MTFNRPGCRNWLKQANNGIRRIHNYLIENKTIKIRGIANLKKILNICMCIKNGKRYMFIIQSTKAETERTKETSTKKYYCKLIQELRVMISDFCWPWINMMCYNIYAYTSGTRIDRWEAECDRKNVRKFYYQFSAKEKK